MNEAQLLADRMVVIEKGRVIREGTTAAVMTDPDALRAMGIREVAAMLPVIVAGIEEDGLTQLTTATGPLYLPGIDSPPGTRLRVRIMAHEVILSRERPVGLSAQNILPCNVTGIRGGEGPGVMVHLAVGGDEIVARITRRAAAQLALQPGDTAHAILKSMSVARDHIAGSAHD
jgi:molybdate transport system ATP-binding protein